MEQPTGTEIKAQDGSESYKESSGHIRSSLETGTIIESRSLVVSAG